MPSSTASDSVHKFQFSTAKLNKVETHGKLECLHQSLIEKKSQVFNKDRNINRDRDRQCNLSYSETCL